MTVSIAYNAGSGVELKAESGYSFAMVSAIDPKLSLRKFEYSVAFITGVSNWLSTNNVPSRVST